MKAYTLDIQLEEQEDGLWRAQAIALPGCFVDAPTMDQALSEIPEVAAMFISLLEEHGKALPSDIRPIEGKQITTTLPVIISDRATEKARVIKSRPGGLSGASSKAETLGLPSTATR